MHSEKTRYPIQPTFLYDHVARRLSGRAKRNETLKVEMRQVFDLEVYVVRKTRRQLKRDGFDVARCTVATLMREMGPELAIRGKP